MLTVKGPIPLAGLIWGPYYTEGAFKKKHKTTSTLYKALIAFSSLWTQSIQCSIKPSNKFNRVHIRNRLFFPLLYAHELS